MLIEFPRLETESRSRSGIRSADSGQPRKHAHTAILRENELENDHIYRKLTEIFREVFDDDSIVLKPETTAADIEDWDSVAHIGLIVAVEERLKIKFKSSELESLHNVGQLARLVEQKLETQRTTN